MEQSGDIIYKKQRRKLWDGKNMVGMESIPGVTGARKKVESSVRSFLIVAICVFAFSAFQLYKIFNGYHKGESEYDDLVKLAVTEDKGEQENGTDDQDGSRFSVDFDALRQINPDVVAGIRFDDRR